MLFTIAFPARSFSDCMTPCCLDCCPFSRSHKPVGTARPLRLAARNRRRLVFLGGVESVLSAMQNFPEDWEVRSSRWTGGTGGGVFDAPSHAGCDRVA